MKSRALPVSIASTPARTAWLRSVVLAAGLALALLAFVPRLFASLEHDHAERTGHGCAACVVAHAPAELPTPVVELATRAPQTIGAPTGLGLVAAPQRAWQVPLACGPPSSGSPLRA